MIERREEGRCVGEVIFPSQLVTQSKQDCICKGHVFQFAPLPPRQANNCSLGTRSRASKVLQAPTNFLLIRQVPPGACKLKKNISNKMYVKSGYNNITLFWSYSVFLVCLSRWSALVKWEKNSLEGCYGCICEVWMNESELCACSVVKQLNRVFPSSVRSQDIV